MDRELWKQVDALLEEALEQPPDQREAFVVAANWRDLTNDRFFDRYPRWSPDGKRIAFTSDRSGRYEIWMLDADATNLRQLTFDSPGDTTFPLV